MTLNVQTRFYLPSNIIKQDKQIFVFIYLIYTVNIKMINLKLVLHFYPNITLIMIY